jgi:multiple sugar transport system substrate-binding protein
MNDKAKSLFEAYAAGKLSRRELLTKTAQLGVAFGAANLMLNKASTDLLAADFNWKAHQGKSLKLLLNKHPYVDAMIANLENFKSLTGMNITYDVFPEDVYFDKVTAALSSRSSEYDAFMTGAYMTWTYGPAGWIEDLNAWIKDSSKTAPNYNWEDMLPGLRASTAWNGVPGGELGSACQTMVFALGIRIEQCCLQPQHVQKSRC